jgi:hypothetical protein
VAQTIGQHGVAAFTSPVNGDAIDATVVTGNDNSTRSAYVDHDSDSGIHVQSSLLAARPAAGTAGRKWMTTDVGAVKLWFDTGAAWEEIAYLPSAGGTVAGALTVTGLITATGGVSGNATTATKLQTPRNINGVAFDGSANITITAVADASTLTGTTLNSPVVASSLTSVGTLTSLTTSGTTSLATSAGALTVRSVPYIWPSSQGAAGTSLVNNGSGTLAWTVVGSAAPTQTDFNTSGTWTKPSSGTMALVEVWGGGGGGGAASAPYTPTGASGGGGGSYKSQVYRLADLAATVTVTVGAGGAGIPLNAGTYTASNGASGGTSSFGSLISAFGGKGGQFDVSLSCIGPGGNTTIPTASLSYLKVDATVSSGSFGFTGISDSVGNRAGSLSWFHVDRTWNGGMGLTELSGTAPNNVLNQLANSVYGGGGGVGSSGASGGTSVFGGNGGNMNTNGSAPAGGGGGSRDLAVSGSGSGAAGRVRVTVFG